MLQYKKIQTSWYMVLKFTETPYLEAKVHVALNAKYTQMCLVLNSAFTLIVRWVGKK